MEQVGEIFGAFVYLDKKIQPDSFSVSTSIEKGIMFTVGELVEFEHGYDEFIKLLADQACMGMFFTEQKEQRGFQKMVIKDGNTYIDGEIYAGKPRNHYERMMANKRRNRNR